MDSFTFYKPKGTGTFYPSVVCYEYKEDKDLLVV